MSRTITLAIAGLADIHPDNAAELLDDHLAEIKNVKVIVPLTEDHGSDGLNTVLDYLDEKKIGWTAVSTPGQPEYIEQALQDAEFVEVVDNPEDIEQHIVDILSTAREDGQETAVMLLWGEDADVEDRERTQTLLELAYDEGLACLDLTAGLDSFAFADDEQEPVEEEPEPEPEPARKSKRRSRKDEAEELTEAEEELTEETAAKPEPKSERRTHQQVMEDRKAVEDAVGDPSHDIKDLTPEPATTKPFPKSPREWKKAAEERPDEAQAMIPPQPSQAASEPENTGQDEERPEPEMPSLDEVLKAVYAHLKATDHANAAVNMSQVRYRPLTQHVYSHLKARAEAQADVVKVFTEPKKPAKEEGPKRGRARTTEDETVAVLELEDGNFKKRGRGRPPAGAKLVDMPVAQARELGLVA